VKLDLHMHSTSSDGELDPAELMRFARHQRGLDLVALTDHDTLGGLQAASDEAEKVGLRFVNGIEISSLWAGRCIHIVGLQIDRENETLARLAGGISAQRSARAVKIAEKLESLGFPNLYGKALKYARNPAIISRMHFAQALTSEGHVEHLQQAFDKYLGDGMPAFVPTLWPALADAVSAIRGAGGVAVLAHPGRYRLTEQWQFDGLMADFQQAGGQAIEVVSGSQSAQYTGICLAAAERFGFYASSGSDFHSRQGKRPLPGAQGEMPAGVKSVLELLKL
jgi:predicted metal-dependent phosphoesterase TrpH